MNLKKSAIEVDTLMNSSKKALRKKFISSVYYQHSHYVQSNLLCFIIFGSGHTNHTNSNPRGWKSFSCTCKLTNPPQTINCIFFWTLLSRPLTYFYISLSVQSTKNHRCRSICLHQRCCWCWQTFAWLCRRFEDSKLHRSFIFSRWRYFFFIHFSQRMWCSRSWI